MDNLNGPLMYINTAQTVNKLSNGQEIYDSRVKDERISKRKKAEPIIIDEAKIKKLENIVLLYKRNMPVTCSIDCESINIEGIPIDINSQYLYVLANGTKIDVELSSIKDFIVLDF